MNLRIGDKVLLKTIAELEADGISANMTATRQNAGTVVQVTKLTETGFSFKVGSTEISRGYAYIKSVVSEEPVVEPVEEVNEASKKPTEAELLRADIAEQTKIVYSTPKYITKEGGKDRVNNPARLQEQDVLKGMQEALRVEELKEKLGIAKVIVNPPAVIIIGTDGTKTVTKTSTDDQFDAKYGFLLAYFLRTSGTSRNLAGLLLENVDVY